MSYGELPVVVYRQSECGRHHGNFIPASYRAILGQPRWRKRLEKVHAQGRRCLPAGDGPWHELDSSVSSDALLMNIFCYPRITLRADVCNILGIESGSRPEFGFRPRVPLLSGAIERTEIDLKLGSEADRGRLSGARVDWLKVTGISERSLRAASSQESERSTFPISSSAMFLRLTRSILISAH